LIKQQDFTLPLCFIIIIAWFSSNKADSYHLTNSKQVSSQLILAIVACYNDQKPPFKNSRSATGMVVHFNLLTQPVRPTFNEFICVLKKWNKNLIFKTFMTALLLYQVGLTLSRIDYTQYQDMNSYISRNNQCSGEMT